MQLRPLGIAFKWHFVVGAFPQSTRTEGVQEKKQTTSINNTSRQRKQCLAESYLEIQLTICKSGSDLRVTLGELMVLKLTAKCEE